MKTLTLEERVRNAAASQAVENVKAEHAYYHGRADATGEWGTIWSRSDECSWAHAFGRMRGFDQVWYGSVTRYDAQAMENWLKLYEYYPEVGGKDPRPLLEASVHTLVTDIIEVAADGKTAKGIWISPGTETAPSPGKEKGAWCWGKYEVEFIKEDGVWKFWHMTLYPLFLTPYNRSWGEPALKMAGNGEMPDMGPYCHPLEKPFWEYGPDAIYPEDEPAVPQRYDSYPGI